MKKDKFLLVFVFGAVLLIATAFFIVLLKPDPTYIAGDTPEAVAHNYLLALQLEEYDRAYSDLSETLPGYPPNVKKFEDSIDNYSWIFRRDSATSLAINSSKIEYDRAIVYIREIRFYHYELFESRQSISNFEIALQLESDQWKIIDSDRYFAWCWDDADGCGY